MEQTLMGRILFGKDANELIGQHNELISGLALLKLKCPKVFFTIEHAIVASYYHDKYCIPAFKQISLAEIPLATEQYKKEKEELVYLREEVIYLKEEVINLREEVAKLKFAKKKTTTKSKKSKSKR